MMCGAAMACDGLVKGIDCHSSAAGPEGFRIFMKEYYAATLSRSRNPSQPLLGRSIYIHSFNGKASKGTSIPRNMYLYLDFCLRCSPHAIKKKHRSFRGRRQLRN